MEKVIHIVPLGFEIDRAVKPFEAKNGLRPNKIYILSTVEFNDVPVHFVEKHRSYVKKVKEKLEFLHVEVEIVDTNLRNLLEVIKKTSNIIRREKADGNLVYVNMSACGRLTSIAVTLSGMVHDAKVYYVEADTYSDNVNDMEKHGYSICKRLSIKYLKNFRIHLPDELQLKVLVEIFTKGKMRTLDIINFLTKEKVIGYPSNYYRLKRSEKTSIIMKLNRNIIEKLEESGYIVKRRLGRENEYILTESGEYITSISGLLEI